jgi:hypothetical protein
MQITSTLVPIRYYSYCQLHSLDNCSGELLSQIMYHFSKPRKNGIDHIFFCKLSLSCDCIFQRRVTIVDGFSMHRFCLDDFGWVYCRQLKNKCLCWGFGGCLEDGRPNHLIAIPSMHEGGGSHLLKGQCCAATGRRWITPSFWQRRHSRTINGLVMGMHRVMGVIAHDCRRWLL